MPPKKPTVKVTVDASSVMDFADLTAKLVNLVNLADELVKGVGVILGGGDTIALRNATVAYGRARLALDKEFGDELKGQGFRRHTSTLPNRLPSW